MSTLFEQAVRRVYADREGKEYASLADCYGNVEAETIVENTAVKDVLELHNRFKDDPIVNSAIDKLGRSLLNARSNSPYTLFGVDVVFAALYQAISEHPDYLERHTMLDLTTYPESTLAFEGLAELVKADTRWITMPSEAAYIMLRVWYDFYFNS